YFFFSSRRRHTISYGDWSSDVCSSDLVRSDRDHAAIARAAGGGVRTSAAGIVGAGALGMRRAEPAIKVIAGRSAQCAGVGGVGQIGRASCRERVWRAGVVGAVERKMGG